jgi:hypothetical protein
VLVNAEDVLLDLAEECSGEEAERLAVEFAWLASAIAELMIARVRCPPAAWFAVYQREIGSMHATVERAVRA